MSSEIRIPLTEIKVKFRAGSRRPITELDRLMMRAIAAGTNSVDKLRSIFQLPERLLVECLVDLMDMAFLALDMDGNGFRLTEFGIQNLENGLTTFGERLDDTDEMTFLREDITGRIGPRFWYDREKGDMPSNVVTGSIPLGEIEQLLFQEFKTNKDHQGKHLHSVESVVPVRNDISFKVTVDKKGGISGLPTQWGHLHPLLRVEAEKRTGINYATSPQIDERGDDPSWIEVNLREDDLFLTASKHETALLDAIKQARSHLLILSAHVSEGMLAKLKAPIGDAIQRGVRVDVLWGLSSPDGVSESNSATTKKWLQEVRRSSSSGAGEYLSANEDPLHSDAKILIGDVQDGSYQAIVGSYNWLYGFGGTSAERPGSEVGIRLSDPRLVGSICSTLSGWLNDRGQQSNGISLRWQQIGLYLAQQPPRINQGGSTVKACVLYDERHAEMLREGLMSATHRLLVTSHKLNRSAIGNANDRDGKLSWLIKRNPAPEFQIALIAGRPPKSDSWEPKDQNKLEELVNGFDSSIRLGEGTHARVLVYDDVAIVSSYNFLSTTQDKRQVGVILRDAAIAKSLWNTFKVASDLSVFHG